MIGIRSFIILAGIIGAIGVGIGAIGAHGLPDALKKKGLTPEVIEKKLEQCETAVRYQIFHALALLVIGLVPASANSKLFSLAGWSMVAGLCLFSGGIYSVVFLDTLGHWAIIPSGGLLMIVGWFLIALAGMRIRKL